MEFLANKEKERLAMLAASEEKERLAQLAAAEGANP